ncbi:hypothetical protein GA0115245_103216 [Streptomyces sp. di188]|nr:hypothetical protein GA0115245_103216 [Streptomyces sp. di188]SCD45006.1 hypothetical protein GA0115238_109516 [Streptomyces sp. di50b]
MVVTATPTAMLPSLGDRVAGAGSPRLPEAYERSWQPSHIDPRHDDVGNDDVGNEDAGVRKTAGRARLARDKRDIDDVKVPLQVKRATRVTVSASSEPVRKGRTLTVTGKVTRADGDTRTYQTYAGRPASLQFKAAGAEAYPTVRKVKSDSTGAHRTTVKATRSGTWRWVHYGDTTSGAKAPAGDYVAVRQAPPGGARARLRSPTQTPVTLPRRANT